MTKFEYKVEYILPKWSFNDGAYAEEILAKLNELGEEGWEIVSIDYLKTGSLFKRRIEE